MKLFEVSVMLGDHVWENYLIQAASVETSCSIAMTKAKKQVTKEEKKGKLFVSDVKYLGTLDN